MKPPTIEGLVTKGDDDRWAIFSPDDKYRYALGVSWAPHLFEWADGLLPMFDVVCMNPSTATHEKNDPTLLRLIHFAKMAGCGRMLLRNLAAYRSAYPVDLGKVEDPVGPRNDDILCLPMGNTVRVAAWGNFHSFKVHRRLLRSVSIVRAHFRDLHTFGFTKAGEPKHPLYLPNRTPVRLWGLP